MISHHTKIYVMLNGVKHLCPNVRDSHLHLRAVQVSLSLRVTESKEELE